MSIRRAVAGIASILPLAGALLSVPVSAQGFGIGLDTLFAAPPASSADVFSGPARGEVIGAGPSRVALIVPLSGPAAPIGRAIANGARLGMEQALSLGGHHIHIVLKDAGTSSASARTAAQEAIAEGATLILGPLTAETVQGAGEAARAANIPLIGFSSTIGVAGDGVHLLSVLPEAEISRALAFARAQGAQSAAAIVPDTPLGRLQAQIFSAAAQDQGLAIAGVELFGTEAGARAAVERLLPALNGGGIDALYLPDRSTAPSFATLLGAAQVPRETLLIIGSADWEGDSAIAQSAYLSGAVYPAVDPAGLAAIAPAYRARFGENPHPFATLGVTAALLANTPALNLSAPGSGNRLVSPGGFIGQDGPLRFYLDGRGEYGLVMRQIGSGSAVTVDPARLVGLPQATEALSGPDAGIPPAAEFR